MKTEEQRIFHDAFDIGMYLKLTNATLEILGGFVFLFAKPSTLNILVLRLTQHELVQDPHDLVANFLRHQAAHLSINAQFFTAIFLLSHGVIKTLLIVALLRRKLWAYPSAIFVFSGFIAYQMYQYAVGGSVWLIALSLVDLIVVILTYTEYNNIKEGVKT